MNSLKCGEHKELEVGSDLTMLETVASGLMFMSMMSVSACALLVPTTDLISTTKGGYGPFGGTAKSSAELRFEITKMTALRMMTFGIGVWLLVCGNSGVAPTASSKCGAYCTGAATIGAFWLVALAIAGLPFVALGSADPPTARRTATKWSAVVGMACLYLGVLVDGCDWLWGKLGNA
jgi:hypothetical protein